MANTSSHNSSSSNNSKKIDCNQENAPRPRYLLLKKKRFVGFRLHGSKKEHMRNDKLVQFCSNPFVEPSPARQWRGLYERTPTRLNKLGSLGFGSKWNANGTSDDD
jgi:hypothetical protein